MGSPAIACAGICTSIKRVGLERLKQLNFRRPKSPLMAHRESLEAYFLKHPPASIKETQAVIKGPHGHRTLADASAAVSPAPGVQAAQGGDDPGQG